MKTKTRKDMKTGVLRNKVTKVTKGWKPRGDGKRQLEECQNDDWKEVVRRDSY
jgi:hypothetical protein